MTARPTPKRARALNMPSTPARLAPPHADETPPKTKPAAEQIAVPAALLLAAESIAAKADKEKNWLQGVMLHAKDTKTGRIVGCDGLRLFVGSFPVEKMPAWLKTGIMLPRVDLKARVGMITKLGNTEVVEVRHTAGEPTVQLTDPAESMAFQVRCGSVERFPDYEMLFDMKSFTDLTDQEDHKPRREWEAVGFNSQHLRHCGEIAKLLEAGMPKEQRSKNGMVVRVFDGDPTAPRVFDFVGWPGALLLIAAVQLVHLTLPAATVQLLAPAVRGTVAALRAHATRWLDAADQATGPEEKAAYLAKAKGFQERVTAILGMAAIEGPEAKPKQPKAPKAAAAAPSEVVEEDEETPEEDEEAGDSAATLH